MLVRCLLRGVWLVALAGSAACAGGETNPFLGGGGGEGGSASNTASSAGGAGGGPASATASSASSSASGAGGAGGSGGSGGESASISSSSTSSTGSTSSSSASSSASGAGGGLPDAGENGASCSNDGQCSGGSCATETDYGYPAGYCYEECFGLGSTCPSGGKCYDDGFAGVCYDTCASAADCRDGYACTDVSNEVPQLGMICLPDCSADAQCVEVQSCVTDPDYGTGFCAECASDADCGALEVCDTFDNTCVAVECKSDADCAEGSSCNAGNACVAPETECADLADNDSDGLYDCEDQSCASGPACVPGAGATGAACSAATECEASGTDPICFTDADTDYPGGYCSEFCDLASDDCKTEGAVCLDVDLQSGNGLCFDGCASDADCEREGYYCINVDTGVDLCLPGCTSDAECEAGMLCDEASKFCVECLSDADCGANGFCWSGTCL